MYSVETGHGKGSYSLRMRTNSFAEARLFFRCCDGERGAKKRLKYNDTILLRVVSWANGKEEYCHPGFYKQRTQ